MSRPYQLMETIDAFLKEVSVKTASDGVKDPGGYQGPSTHPSKSAPADVQGATTGARASENERDVKEDHPAAGVDSTSEGGGGSEEDKYPGGGTVKSETGGQPSVEDDYKRDKVDPPSSHPSHDAEDEGSLYKKSSFSDLCKTASSIANSILADFANGFAIGQPTKEAQTSNSFRQPTQQVTQPQTPTQTEAEKMAAAGYNFAAVLGNEQEMQKQAATALIEQTIRDADFDADLYISFYKGYHAEKQAMLKKADPADGDPTGGAMPPPSMPAMAGAAGLNPGDMPAPTDDGAGGAAPDSVPPGGGDAGAAPDDSAGGAQPSQQDAIMALLALAQDLGIDPSELVAAASGGPNADEAQKVAAVLADAKKQGLKVGPPKTAEEKRLRLDMAAYLRELMGN